MDDRRVSSAEDSSCTPFADLLWCMPAVSRDAWGPYRFLSDVTSYHLNIIYTCPGAFHCSYVLQGLVGGQGENICPPVLLVLLLPMSSSFFFVLGISQATTLCGAWVIYNLYMYVCMYLPGIRDPPHMSNIRASCDQCATLLTHYFILLNWTPHSLQLASFHTIHSWIWFSFFNLDNKLNYI